MRPLWWVGIDGLLLQGREGAEVDCCKPVPPLFFLQHLLNHEGIHVSAGNPPGL